MTASVLTSRRGGWRRSAHRSSSTGSGVDRRGAARLHLDGAGALADALVPADERVVAGGTSRSVNAPSSLGHGEVRMIQHEIEALMCEWMWQ